MQPRVLSRYSGSGHHGNVDEDMETDGRTPCDLAVPCITEDGTKSYGSHRETVKVKAVEMVPKTNRGKKHLIVTTHSGRASGMIVHVGLERQTAVLSFPFSPFNIMSPPQIKLL